MAAEVYKDAYEAYARVWDSRIQGWKQLLAEIVDKHCAYSNMIVSGVGLESLTQVIEAFHSTSPESVFATTGYMEQHGKSLGHWNLLDATGKVVVTGSNFTVYDVNGRMVQIAGFWVVEGSAST